MNKLDWNWLCYLEWKSWEGLFNLPNRKSSWPFIKSEKNSKIESDSPKKEEQK